MVQTRVGLVAMGGVPFVFGNLIFAMGPRLNDVTLVHEVGHVWQFQNGGMKYARRALLAQVRLGRVAAYEWQKQFVAGLKFSAWNPEAQAEMLRDLHDNGDLVVNLQTGLAQVRNGVPVTASVEHWAPISAAFPDLRVPTTTTQTVLNASRELNRMLRAVQRGQQVGTGAGLEFQKVRAARIGGKWVFENQR